AEDQICDAGQDPPAGLRRLLLAAGSHAAILCALSDQQPARILRHAGRADPCRAAHLGQPLRQPRPQEEVTAAGRGCPGLASWNPADIVFPDTVRLVRTAGTALGERTI